MTYGHHTNPPRVLGLLQNMWVRDPDAARRLIARHGQAARFRMIAAWMPKTPSGIALQHAFGDQFSMITWENVASRIAGKSDGAPPADHVHIGKLLLLCRPDIVLAFGRTAVDAMEQHQIPVLIRARHPRSCGLRSSASVPDGPVTCSYSGCLVYRPLYMPVVETDDDRAFVLYSWTVCRDHRFQLAEFLSTRARMYRIMADELRNRDVSPPAPGEFDVEFEELPRGV